MKKSRKILISLATTGLICAVAVSANAGPRGGADTNGDGNVTRAEMMASVSKKFAKMDVNKDGKLNKADRKARRDARFAKMDSNNDGGLSPAELKAAKVKRAQERFARMDTDGNGLLSKEEMRKKRGGKHKMRGRGRGGRGQGAMRMMKRADTNGDMAVSLQEMRTAATARFNKVDTNNDGVLTKEERQAARKKHREQRKMRHKNRRG